MMFSPEGQSSNEWNLSFTPRAQSQTIVQPSGPMNEGFDHPSLVNDPGTSRTIKRVENICSYRLIFTKPLVEKKEQVLAID